MGIDAKGKGKGSGKMDYRYLFLVIMALCGIALASPSVTDSRPSAGAKLPVINSQVMKINYQVPSTLTGSVSEVVLWHRFNGGDWQQGENFPIGQPITFTAPQEGMYDFIVHPDSGSPFEPDASAMFRCLIDFNQPVLQITEYDYHQGALLVRWRAFDQNFSDRPIEIYLLTQTSAVSLGKFPNKGIAVLSVDPKHFPARIRVVALDRAGNYQIDTSEMISAEIPAEDTAPAVASQPAEPPVQPITATQPTTQMIVLPEAQREYNLGVSYRLRGEYALARVHLARAVELAPTMIDGHLDLAGVFGAMGQYNQAIRTYHQALALDGNNLAILHGLGRAYVHQKQYEEAIVHLERAVELDEQNIQGWIDLGDAFWMQGRRDEARSAWMQARDLSEEFKETDLRYAIDARVKLIE